MNILLALVMMIGTWSAGDKLNIQEATNRIAARLEEVSGVPAYIAFKSIYGDLTATSGIDPWLAYNCEARDNGFACKAGIHPSQVTIIHELGHVFDYHTGAGDVLGQSTIYAGGKYVTGIQDGEWYRGMCGYVSPYFPHVVHGRYDSAGMGFREEWADMFMNWVNESFADDECGRARMEFMDRIVAVAVLMNAPDLSMLEE